MREPQLGIVIVVNDSLLAGLDIWGGMYGCVREFGGIFLTNRNNVIFSIISLFPCLVSDNGEHGVVMCQFNSGASANVKNRPGRQQKVYWAQYLFSFTKVIISIISQFNSG